MGLSISYHLSAIGRPEEIRQRMSDWRTQVQLRWPDCVTELRIADEDVSFQFLPGLGSEIAPLRLHQDKQDFWTGFGDCKTQFAGCAQHGGPANFLKVHGRLIAALDIGRSLGLIERVSDDGGYWTHRSVEKLLAQFQVYQGVVGALVAQIRAAGFSVESPVEHPSEPLQRKQHSAQGEFLSDEALPEPSENEL